MTECIVMNAFDTKDMQPSLRTIEGSVSYGQKLFDARGSDTSINVWHAVPGTYQYGGNDAGETFMVLSGTAEITLDGGRVHELKAGSIVSLPPNTPSQMHVIEPLHKVALNLW